MALVNSLDKTSQRQIINFCSFKRGSVEYKAAYTDLRSLNTLEVVELTITAKEMGQEHVENVMKVLRGK